MLNVSNLSLQFGKRILFENVNINFAPGNCYGIIGANGAGKSTFLKILSGEIDPTTGNVSTIPGHRIAVLQQNQFEYDEVEVLKTVIIGHKKLYDIMTEKELVYSKEVLTDEDGNRIAELESEFAELNGWEAESEAASLLVALGIQNELHEKKMADLTGNEKVKVLLAQTLFGNPDVLLLDEPTNHLDIQSINWLEEFLINFKNTVIVVSHDRHFLNKVCTHIADIDFGKIKVYTGNYAFWWQSSQLAMQQAKDSNKRIEAKREELQEFISRFSANASKSKQATSRKKLLEKLTVEDIQPSSRRIPYVHFKPDRETGNNTLEVINLCKKLDDDNSLNNITFKIEKGEKIAFVGRHDNLKTALFKILMDEMRPDSGSYDWGVTTSQAYFPKENSAYFDSEDNLIDWLRPYSKEKDDQFIRGYLGRMLFSGEEALKKANVLSGGEKVRCMLAKMMLSGANVLVLDEPTNHLDLEAITGLNNGLMSFTGTILFVSHDHQFMQTIADRIIEITPNGIIDKKMTFDEYLEDPKVQEQRLKLGEFLMV